MMRKLARPHPGVAGLRREVAYGRQRRVGLLLESPGRPICYACEVGVDGIEIGRPLAIREPLASDVVVERR